MAIAKKETDVIDEKVIVTRKKIPMESVTANDRDTPGRTVLVVLPGDFTVEDIQYAEAWSKVSPMLRDFDQFIITTDTTDWYARALLFSKAPWCLKIEAKGSGFAVDTFEPVTNYCGVEKRNGRWFAVRASDRQNLGAASGFNTREEARGEAYRQKAEKAA